MGVTHEDPMRTLEGGFREFLCPEYSRPPSLDRYEKDQEPLELSTSHMQAQATMGVVGVLSGRSVQLLNRTGSFRTLAARQSSVRWA